MIDLKMITTREELREITGLSSDNHDEALWNAGFNLDDWDVCFVSDVPLTNRNGWDYPTEDAWDIPIEDARWLVNQMECYCVGYEHTKYNGKHYYMVYHS